MLVISYLVYPEAGAKDRLMAALRTLAGCEVLPAENRELLVVVAESASQAEAGELEQGMLTIEGCSGIALVAAFDTEEDGK